MCRILALSLLTICMGILVMPVRAFALNIEPITVGDEDLQARFLIDNDDSGKAALYLRMANGWHTYWIVPGDVGLPPRFSWDNQNNIQDIHVFYPPPKRFDEMGFTTFGYTHEVLFPIQFVQEKKDTQSTAELSLNTMICKDICIPKTLKINFDTNETVSLENGDKALLALAHQNILRNNPYNITLQNVQIFSDHLAAVVTPSVDARDKDKEEMDIFAIIYDTDDMMQTEPENGLPLTGKVEKTSDPKTGNIIFNVPKNPDISDLNLYTYGKIVRVLVSYRDSGTVQDIQIPNPTDQNTKTTGQKLRKHVE